MEEVLVVTNQTIVSTDSPIALKPLLESAIRSELRMLELSLRRTHQRLQTFEKQYGLNSEHFERRFAGGEMGESLDFIEWAGEIKTYHLLKAQQQALQGVRLN